MSRYSSNTDTESDIFMADACHCEGASEDTDDTPLERTFNPSFGNSLLRHSTATNYFEGREHFAPEFQDHEEDHFELERESGEDVVELVQRARARSIKEKKAAVKAADAVNKHATTSRKRLVKSVKNKKASAGRTPNVPARQTRSSTQSQPAASTQIIDSPGIEIAQPAENKILTRKTWLPKEKAILKAALVSWWEAKGADKYNHPTNMVLPKKKNDSDWDCILARCKELDESFDRGRDGLINIAGKINPLPAVSDSLAALR
ncbi:hypothetical protein FRC04_001803 [Tulasnella sp. 424]|nr:hypothetical protein FRC04_001803 [Tulasnella sp. 424]